MLHQEVIERILGISTHTPTKSEEMLSELKLTILPYDKKKVSSNVLFFMERFEAELSSLGVQLIPTEKALHIVPLHSALMRAGVIILRDIHVLLYNLTHSSQKKHPVHPSAILNILRHRRRFTPGISVVSVGEQETNMLPMDRTTSFRRTSIVTVLDMPDGVSKKSDFYKHFDTAMSLFAHHMSNIVIGVGSDEWLLYNFNASHPFFSLRGEDFREALLSALIPKIVAPIQPVRLSEFHSLNKHFDIHDERHAQIVKDFIEGSHRMQGTGLYPPGKKIDELPFRNGFYRWIGKIHLDHRNGMSFGFLAWQMPTKIAPAMSMEVAMQNFKKEMIPPSGGIFEVEDETYLRMSFGKEDLILHLPEVEILTQRSGADKTNLNPSRDLLKLKLHNGVMSMETPSGLVLTPDYKPSFDTRVILAHAIGNAIIAAVLSYKKPGSRFITNLTQQGLAIAHWHGYVDPERIPEGWHVHGEHNPHVACSSPQSAIYALDGKIRAFEVAMSKNGAFEGDIHIEPHHGTNIVYPSLSGLADFFLSDTPPSSLGNKYLENYRP